VNGEVSVNRGAFRATKPYRAKILAIKRTAAAATDTAVRMKEKNEAPLGQKMIEEPRLPPEHDRKIMAVTGVTRYILGGCVVRRNAVDAWCLKEWGARCFARQFQNSSQSVSAIRRQP
jgi:hypothetical protein